MKMCFYQPEPTVDCDGQEKIKRPIKLFKRFYGHILPLF